MEAAVLLVALAAVCGACVVVLRVLAGRFDSQIGACQNGRQRALRIRRDLVEL